jgi:hypothetical protein
MSRAFCAPVARGGGLSPSRYSMRRKPRFLSPSRVFIASYSRERSTSTRFVLFNYVENQHQVLRLKVAADGRVVADTGTKNWCACEVDNISTARVVDLPEFIPELLGR